jgi:hypothetical protein
MPGLELRFVNDLGEPTVHPAAASRRSAGVHTAGEQRMGEIQPVTVDLDNALVLRLL